MSQPGQENTRSTFPAQGRTGRQPVVSINDFSMVSMLRYAANRQAILTTDTEGTLLARLMKTAAVVEIVTRGRGQYSYYQPEEAVSVAQKTSLE